MRLNMDCIRSILLCVEENTGLRKYCSFIDKDLEAATSSVFGESEETLPYQTELLKKYNNDVLIYHIKYCISAELIISSDQSSDYKILIFDLTPKGHEFLSSIRENSNWTKTKEIGGKIGSFSLSMVSKIAEGIATAYLKQQLGLL